MKITRHILQIEILFYNHGLTTWKNAPDGRILKSDTSKAKNYLQEKTNQPVGTHSNGLL